MKRFLIFLLGCFLFFGCEYSLNRTVDNSEGTGIPNNVAHIEFWNGGSKIAEANNAHITIKTEAMCNLYGKNVSFYKYIVDTDKGSVTIIDSEALAILYVVY
ncbi:hypothetical protein [Treponema peruense]|uniref:Lipoprotein n=1 Tax=Treponema peruense TaxID=2787628 RepID=A0A7T3RE48_9SPIR|nr:hypothetical protein [Treponema peruense]QQA01337.1 hypothetical protein IWA51_01585 [Treponema peruense]